MHTKVRLRLSMRALHTLTILSLGLAETAKWKWYANLLRKNRCMYTNAKKGKIKLSVIDERGFWSDTNLRVGICTRHSVDQQTLTLSESLYRLTKPRQKSFHNVITRTLSYLSSSFHLLHDDAIFTFKSHDFTMQLGELHVLVRVCVYTCRYIEQRESN